jgi:hypothetical protein
MSFGKSMFAGAFNQKIIKVDLISDLITLIRDKTDSEILQKANHGRRAREHDMWGRPAPPVGRLAQWPHMSVPLCYIGSPPP